MSSIHINSLATEILTEIFIQAVNQPDAPWSIFALSAVCSRWRQIALALPKLWSAICIDLGCRHSRPPLSIVDLLLERSSTAPRNISLLDSEEVSSDITALRNYMSAAFQSLIRHIHRWRCLRATTLMVNLYGQFFTTIPLVRAEKLRVIEGSYFHHGSSRFDYNIAGVLLSLSHTQSLRTFKWETDSHQMPQTTLTSNFPLGQLTRLDLHCPMSLKLMFEVMQECTAVVTMIIRFHVYSRIYYEKDSRSSLSTVSLPNLRVLRLGLDKPHYRMFDFLDLPNLRILDLFTRSQDWGNINPLSNFISSRRHSLQVVYFHCLGLELQQALSFIPIVAHIPVLQITTAHRDLEDVVLEAARIERDGELFPASLLTRLKIVPTGAAGVSMGWVDDTIYRSLQGDLSEPAVVELCR